MHPVSRILCIVGCCKLQAASRRHLALLLPQLMPFYDEDTPLLYLAGKGDANIRFGALPTSAPGLGTPLPHLHRDWAHRCHICAGTGLTPCS